MRFVVKSPSGTEISVDLENNTVSVPKVAMIDQPILGWGMAQQDGENVQYARINGNQKLLIGVDYLQTVVNNRKKYAQAKLEAAVPGITLLQAAHCSEAAYFAALSEMMEDEMNDGVNPPQAPEINTDELSTMYPRAALYIKADAYSNASNDAKSSAGDKAKKILEEGGREDEANAMLENWLSVSAAI